MVEVTPNSWTFQLRGHIPYITGFFVLLALAISFLHSVYRLSNRRLLWSVNFTLVSVDTFEF